MKTLLIKMDLRTFLLNNQPDALIIQIYSVIKLYMFRFQAESGWNCVPS